MAETVLSSEMRNTCLQGGPDGGNGMTDGNVIFKVDEGASTLANFRYKRKYKAGNGQNGGPEQKNRKKEEKTL